MSLTKLTLFQSVYEQFPTTSPGNCAYEDAIKTVLFRTLQPSLDEISFYNNTEVKTFACSFSKVVKKYLVQAKKNRPHMFSQHRDFFQTAITFDTVPMPMETGNGDGDASIGGFDSPPQNGAVFTVDHDVEDNDMPLLCSALPPNLEHDYSAPSTSTGKSQNYFKKFRRSLY